MPAAVPFTCHRRALLLHTLRSHHFLHGSTPSTSPDQRTFSDSRSLPAADILDSPVLPAIALRELRPTPSHHASTIARMPFYRSVGIAATLCTYDLQRSVAEAEPIAPVGASVRKTPPKIQADDTRAWKLLDERALRWRDDQTGVMQFLGASSDLPFFMVECGRNVLGPAVPATLASEADRLREEGDGEQEEALRLCVDTRAVDSTAKWPRTAADESLPHLKVDVLLNGCFVDVAFLNRSNNAIQSRGDTLVFQGTRLDRQAEAPWVYRRDAKSHQAQHFAAADRWAAIGQALNAEAILRGTYPNGCRPPSGQFLEALSTLPLPPGLQDCSTVAVIDVIVTTGRGCKYEMHDGFKSEPTRMSSSALAIPMSTGHSPHLAAPPGRARKQSRRSSSLRAGARTRTARASRDDNGHLRETEFTQQPGLPSAAGQNKHLMTAFPGPSLPTENRGSDIIGTAVQVLTQEASLSKASLPLQADRKKGKRSTAQHKRTTHDGSSSDDKADPTADPAGKLVQDTNTGGKPAPSSPNSTQQGHRASRGLSAVHDDVESFSTTPQQSTSIDKIDDLRDSRRSFVERTQDAAYDGVTIDNTEEGDTNASETTPRRDSVASVMEPMLKYDQRATSAGTTSKRSTAQCSDASMGGNAALTGEKSGIDMKQLCETGAVGYARHGFTRRVKRARSGAFEEVQVVVGMRFVVL